MSKFAVVVVAVVVVVVISSFMKPFKSVDFRNDFTLVCAQLLAPGRVRRH